MNCTIGNILVTGASGMLGANLVRKWDPKYDIFATGREDFFGNSARRFFKFDLRSDDFSPLIKWSMPKLIVHCAAITNVDYCETNAEEANLVNSLSIKKLMECAPEAIVIFISSDAVFSNIGRPSKESDQPDPISVYGRTKKKAEEYISRNGGPHCIIRTTIVGKNINPEKQSFAEWIVNSLRNGRPVNLFDDCYFTPISVERLIDELEVVLSTEYAPILHLCSRNSVSKFKFGQLLSEKLGLDVSLISPSSIRKHDFKAPRVTDQRMSGLLYERSLKRRLPSVDETVFELASNW